MEVQRDKGTRCFFTVVTLYLFMAVVLAIVVPYAILTGTMMGGMTAIVLFIVYYILFSFCHVGQAFISKVRRGWSHLVFLLKHTDIFH